MSIKSKVKMMFRCSGKSLDNLAVHKGTSVPVVRNLLARGTISTQTFFRDLHLLWLQGDLGEQGTGHYHPSDLG